MGDDYYYYCCCCYMTEEEEEKKQQQQQQQRSTQSLLILYRPTAATVSFFLKVETMTNRCNLRSTLFFPRRRIPFSKGIPFGFPLRGFFFPISPSLE